MLLQKIIDPHSWSKARRRVLPNLRHFPASFFRTCGCCGQFSFFASIGPGDERKICIGCGAYLRYEMLASCIRRMDLRDSIVLEISPGSPVTALLSDAGTLISSFYDPALERGKLFKGQRCEDITRLTFADGSLDLIISADVLEHVPDALAAFQESARVLRPGGSHLFTVPNNNALTIRRASIECGEVVHHCAPEYHDDPLNAEGILAYWSFGPDMGDLFCVEGLEIRMALGPLGKDRRIVWEARRL